MFPAIRLTFDIKRYTLYAITCDQVLPIQGDGAVTRPPTGTAVSEFRANRAAQAQAIRQRRRVARLVLASGQPAGSAPRRSRGAVQHSDQRPVANLLPMAERGR